MRDDFEKLDYRCRYLPQPGDLQRVYFLGPLLSAIGSVIGGVATTAGSIVATVGSTAAKAAGTIATTTVSGVSALGQAIPQAVGGIGELAKAAKPVADLFGAGYGIYQSVEQLKLQKKAQSLAEKQYALSVAQLAQQQVPRVSTVESPMQTFADLLPAASFSWGKPEETTPTEEAKFDLMQYLPFILIAGVVVILLIRK